MSDPVLDGIVVELRDGERWQLRAGAADYERVRFDRYRLRLGMAEKPEIDLELKSQPTVSLFLGRQADPRCSRSGGVVGPWWL